MFHQDSFRKAMRARVPSNNPNSSAKRHAHAARHVLRHRVVNGGKIL